jgi:SAM-dependent methyltransferase
MEQPLIVCPFCKSELIEKTSSLFCQACDKSFLYREGILCFGEEDEFYEGKFVGTKDLTPDRGYGVRSILKRINYYLNIGAYEARFLTKSLARITNGSMLFNILDFGCGGGTSTLPSFGKVVGVDLSVSSLLQARSLYDQVYQIDGEYLPFPDGSFDIAFSSHVFGHIPLNQKPRVIGELFRILRPGGYLISSIECNSESIIYRRAQKYPGIFSKCYIEPHGHYGLELPEGNFRRFREAGFAPIIEIADIHKGYLRPVTSYENLALYKGKDSLLYFLGLFSKMIAKSLLLTRGFDILFGLAIPLAYLFTPPSHRDSAKVVYQKPCEGLKH